MKLLSYLFALVLLLTSYACEVELFGCLDAEGDTIRQTVSLPSISKIDINIAANVFITEGESQLIEIEAAQNVIDRIISDSDTGSDKWDVEINGCSNIDDVIIYARLVELESLDISGSGRIETVGIFENIDKLDLEVDGNGRMDIQLAAVEKVDIEINGDATIKVSGVCQTESIDINGNGQVQNFGLVANDCKVDINGNGDVEVFVEDELKVDFSGSGSVCYRGSPTVDLDVSGSGQVNDCN